MKMLLLVDVGEILCFRLAIFLKEASPQKCLEDCALTSTMPNLVFLVSCVILYAMLMFVIGTRSVFANTMT
jgi:hypothetical protein